MATIVQTDRFTGTPSAAAPTQRFASNRLRYFRAGYFRAAYFTAMGGSRVHIVNSTDRLSGTLTVTATYRF